MKIIAVINQKGGVGKTTTVVNLGVALANLNKKVLLIDLDPQANLTYSFGIDTGKGIMSEVLQGKQTIQTILIERERLQIAPASRSLSDVEIALINKIGRENKLKQGLTGLTSYDFVFIDCPPSLSILTVNALNTADEVLIPIQMEVLSLQGLKQLLDTIAEVKTVLNKNLKVKGLIAMMFDTSRNLSHEVTEQVKRNVKERFFKTVIRKCVRIAEAPSFAKSVLSYAPGSNGAIDFQDLATEFLKGSVK